jgi:hypothetical protein
LPFSLFAISAIQTSATLRVALQFFIELREPIQHAGFLTAGSG